MKIKALITMIVLGTSSVAIAQPTDREPYDPDRFDQDRYDRDDRWDRDGRWDRDRRWDRDETDRFDGPRRYRSSWVSLAEPVELSRGREIIDVNRRGRFTQLRLQTVAGASYIDRVIVRFRDGSRQLVEVNRALTPHSRMIEFLLEGANRRIDSIKVVGRSQRGAAIQVFGI